MSYIRTSGFALGNIVLFISILLCGCSKKEDASIPRASQPVNVPQFLATLDSLPMDQRKAYVKQHPAEEQAVMASDDPQQVQELTNSLTKH